MENDCESKILDIELTQEKIKSMVNITYSQPVSYFRKKIKLEMDILKPYKAEKYPAVLFVPVVHLRIATRKTICSRDWKLQSRVMWLRV